MNFWQWVRMIFAGAMEGILKWLPVSDTGHQQFFQSICGETELLNGPFLRLAAVVMEAGALFALLLSFSHKLNPVSGYKTADQKRNTASLLGKVLVSGIPFFAVASLMELLLPRISDMIFRSNWTVVITMLLGGAMLLITEKYVQGKDPKTLKISELDGKTALKVGAFELLLLFAGSGHIELVLCAYLLFSASRYVATEMAFYAAIPITLTRLVLACVRYFAIDKMGLGATQIVLLAVVGIVSMAVSLVVLRNLMHYLKRHSTRVFGLYRIFAGVLALVVLVIRL